MLVILFYLTRSYILRNIFLLWHGNFVKSILPENPHKLPDEFHLVWEGCHNISPTNVYNSDCWVQKTNLRISEDSRYINRNPQFECFLYIHGKDASILCSQSKTEQFFHISLSSSPPNILYNHQACLALLWKEFSHLHS